MSIRGLLGEKDSRQLSPYFQPFKVELTDDTPVELFRFDQSVSSVLVYENRILNPNWWDGSKQFFRAGGQRLMSPSQRGTSGNFELTLDNTNPSIWLKVVGRFPREYNFKFVGDVGHNSDTAVTARLVARPKGTVTAFVSFENYEDVTTDSFTRSNSAVTRSEAAALTTYGSDAIVINANQGSSANFAWSPRNFNTAPSGWNDVASSAQVVGTRNNNPTENDVLHSIRYSNDVSVDSGDLFYVVFKIPAGAHIEEYRLFSASTNTALNLGGWRRVVISGGFAYYASVQRLSSPVSITYTAQQDTHGASRLDYTAGQLAIDESANAGEVAGAHVAPANAEAAAALSPYRDSDVDTSALWSRSMYTSGTPTRTGSFIVDSREHPRSYIIQDGLNIGGSVTNWRQDDVTVDNRISIARFRDLQDQAGLDGATWTDGDLTVESEGDVLVHTASFSTAAEAAGAQYSYHGGGNDNIADPWHVGTFTVDHRAQVYTDQSEILPTNLPSRTTWASSITRSTADSSPGEVYLWIRVPNGQDPSAVTVSNAGTTTWDWVNSDDTWDYYLRNEGTVTVAGTGNTTFAATAAANRNVYFRVTTGTGSDFEYTLGSGSATSVPTGVTSIGTHEGFDYYRVDATTNTGTSNYTIGIAHDGFYFYFRINVTQHNRRFDVVGGATGSTLTSLGEHIGRGGSSDGQYGYFQIGSRTARISTGSTPYTARPAVSTDTYFYTWVTSANATALINGRRVVDTSDNNSVVVAPGTTGWTALGSASQGLRYYKSAAVTVDAQTSKTFRLQAFDNLAVLKIPHDADVNLFRIIDTDNDSVQVDFTDPSSRVFLGSHGGFLYYYTDLSSATLPISPTDPGREWGLRMELYFYVRVAEDANIGHFRAVDASDSTKEYVSAGGFSQIGSSAFNGDDYYKSGETLVANGFVGTVELLDDFSFRVIVRLADDEDASLYRLYDTDNDEVEAQLSEFTDLGTVSGTTYYQSPEIVVEHGPRVTLVLQKGEEVVNEGDVELLAEAEIPVDASQNADTLTKLTLKGWLDASVKKSGSNEVWVSFSRNTGDDVTLVLSDLFLVPYNANKSEVDRFTPTTQLETGLYPRWTGVPNNSVLETPRTPSFVTGFQITSIGSDATLGGSATSDDLRKVLVGFNLAKGDTLRDTTEGPTAVLVDASRLNDSKLPFNVPEGSMLLSALIRRPDGASSGTVTVYGYYFVRYITDAIDPNPTR